MDAGEEVDEVAGGASGMGKVTFRLDFHDLIYKSTATTAMMEKHI